MALNFNNEDLAPGSSYGQKFNFTDSDIQSLAKEAGYKGPKEFASSFLYGTRDAKGNVLDTGSFALGRRENNAVDQVLSRYGLDRGMLDSAIGSQVTQDQQSADMLGTWSEQVGQRGFSLKPWMVAAAPFAVGGLQGAGLLGTEAAGAGALEGVAGAAGEAAGAGAFTGGAGGGGALSGEALTGGALGGELAGGAIGGGALSGGSALGSFSLSDLPGILKSIPKEIWGAGIQGVLGYLGADAKGDALKDIANSQSAIGAPYRDLLQKSYGKNFDLMSQPGYGDAFDRMADISTRSWSAKSGNPANNPGIQGSILNDVWTQGYLPALSNYRGQLGQFGGMGLNTSATASLAGADFSSPWLTGLGAAGGSLFGNSDVFGQEQKKDPMKLTVGGNVWGS